MLFPLHLCIYGYVFILLRSCINPDHASSKPTEEPSPQPPLFHDAFQGLKRDDNAQEQMKGAAATTTCATTGEEDSSNAKYCCCVVEEAPSPADDKWPLLSQLERSAAAQVQWGALCVFV